MRKLAKLLLNRALDGLLLSVDHFNRPWDRGRPEAVLINLDHGFEMLLKAAILHRGGRIREQRAKQTIGFDHCVRKCLSDAQVQCLAREQALTLQIINSLRDAAQHYILEISEQELYLHTQAGVTLFRDLLSSVFGLSLAEYLPERVLPVSTSPPQDINILVRDQVEEIRRLLAPHSRKWTEARGKIRSLAILEAAVNGNTIQPSDPELNAVLRKIASGERWDRLFPGVARLRLDTEGSGPTFSIRITKAEGIPIRLVREDEEATGVVAIRRVNELGFYSLGLNQLAERVGLSGPKTLAVVDHLSLQADEEYFKELQIGKSKFKRYSQKALQRIRNEIPNLDIDDVWRTHKQTRRPARNQ